MKKITMVAALAVAALAADAQAPAAAQGAVHGVNKADMDMSVRPGDDFYQYAGGGWLKANPSKSVNFLRISRRKSTLSALLGRRWLTSTIWLWIAFA